MMQGIIVFIVVAAICWLVYSDRRRRKKAVPVATDIEKMLADYVAFYSNLDDRQKVKFVQRVNDFLCSVTIRGVDVVVEDLDRVLVAAGAVSLIFAFPDWKYNNISEVLLYKGSFTKQFDTDRGDRNVLGMVGDGALHREMLLSQPSLRASFANATDGHNTVIHEFAHLLDKADGAVDGVPDYLLTKPYMKPWADMVHETIAMMRDGKAKDISIYGATNEAEFFAVITEYFFERPAALKENHPELFKMLEMMFHPQLAVTA